jgi:YidC/Oxa1 family membrane protein insertase
VDESMEKRLLLSLALSMAVLMVFGWLFTPAPDPDPSGSASAVVVQGQAGPPPDAGEVLEPAGIETVPTNPIPVAQETSQAESAEGVTLPEELHADTVESILVETGRFSVWLSNEGARLERLQLKEYRGADGETVDLVDSDISRSVGWPLAIVTGDPEVDRTIETALFVFEQEANSVQFAFAAGGLKVFKEYRLNTETYSMEVEAEVTQNGTPLAFSIAWQGEFGDQSIDYRPAFSNVVFLEGESFERVNVESPDDLSAIAPTRFIGVEDQFFLAAFRLDSGLAAPVATQTAVNPAAEEVVFTPRVQVPYIGPAATLYVGPKQQDSLRQVDPELVEVIDYGFFEVIVRPLLLALLWLYGYIGNFGWAIIALTLAINFVFFPLRMKQQMSMLKLQKIQPQMRTLQDKFKKLKSSDPRKQEVQAEMMGLYKKHGVNPVGGCLPLLLQMPFLFAIFSMLRTSIELRGAPWMLWIQDLSAADPYYVLPVLMGGSMFVMQRMTPMAGDPTQVRLMRMMPLFLIVMFLRQSSGLMLYWLTGNLVGAAQQYFINKNYRSSENGKNKDRSSETPELPSEEPSAESTDEVDSGDPSAPKRRRRRGRKK